jgi:hypothetical protein
MHAAKFLVAFAFGLTATLAQAAGFRFIEVPVRLPLTSRTKASSGHVAEVRMQPFNLRSLTLGIF